MHQIRLRLDPAGRAYSAPPNPYLDFTGLLLREGRGHRKGKRRKGITRKGRESRGPTSKGRGWEGERKGKWGKGKERGRGREGEWREGGACLPMKKNCSCAPEFFSLVSHCTGVSWSCTGATPSKRLWSYDLTELYKYAYYFFFHSHYCAFRRSQPLCHLLQQASFLRCPSFLFITAFIYLPYFSPFLSPISFLPPLHMHAFIFPFVHPGSPGSAISSHPRQDPKLFWLEWFFDWLWPICDCAYHCVQSLSPFQTGSVRCKLHQRVRPEPG